MHHPLQLDWVGLLPFQVGFPEPGGRQAADSDLRHFGMTRPRGLVGVVSLRLAFLRGEANAKAAVMPLGMEPSSPSQLRWKSEAHACCAARGSSAVAHRVRCSNRGPPPPKATWPATETRKLSGMATKGKCSITILMSSGLADSMLLESPLAKISPLLMNVAIFKFACFCDNAWSWRKRLLEVAGDQYRRSIAIRKLPTSECLRGHRLNKGGGVKTATSMEEELCNVSQVLVR
mmetsp:Transcript_65899/g.129904  ORF Transcript_65899/g.129904 Transcript_65899/m.129904 type:complete len:233 (-) Transcript_65899:461-1159(-)